jgi:hypothetical protein
MTMDMGRAERSFTLAVSPHEINELKNLNIRTRGIDFNFEQNKKPALQGGLISVFFWF